MRKRTVYALMMTLCLLAACGGEAGTGNNTDELALDIRADYLSMSGCTARMDVTADYGERVYTYTLDLSYQKDGDTTLAVVAPEEVAGVTARAEREETFLEFDGVSLGDRAAGTIPGSLRSARLRPCSAVPGRASLRRAPWRQWERASASKWSAGPGGTARHREQRSPCGSMRAPMP